MSNQSRWRYVTAAAMAAAIALSVPFSGGAQAASSEIKVNLNGGVYETESAPYVKDGTVFLPVRDMGELLGTVVFWNSTSKTVTMTYPGLTVKLDYNTKKATVNGKEVKLTASPQMIKGRIYVPMRFLSEATGAKVDWKSSTRTVSLTHSQKYIQGLGVNTSIWVNRETGDLYIAHPFEQVPVHTGKINADFKEYVSVNAVETSKGNMVVTLMDNYGEPHVHYDAYGVLIRDNKIVSQKKAKYFQRYEENAIYYQSYNEDKKAYEEFTMLTDGRSLTVFDSVGKVVAEHDLQKLTGKDESHSVLGAGKGYLVVRPNQTGFATLIDLEKNTSVQLYEKLLTGEDLEYAKLNDVPYHGDLLTYLGEDTSTGLLQFGYDSPFDSSPAKVYTYNRLTGETGIAD